MTRYEAQAEIARSADEVWTYAADILRHTEWMSVADAHLLAGDGTQVGARGRERLLLGPFKWDVEFEVAEAEPGRRLLWRSTRPALRHGGRRSTWNRAGRHRCERGTTALRRCTDDGGSCPRSSRWKAPPA